MTINADCLSLTLVCLEFQSIDFVTSLVSTNQRDHAQLLFQFYQQKALKQLSPVTFSKIGKCIFRKTIGGLIVL